MKLYHVHYKTKINKVCIIALIWAMIGVVITLYDYFALHSQMSTGMNSSFNFLKLLFINTAAGFTGGTVGGSILVFYINEKFRDKPYWITIVLVALFLVIIYTVLMMLVALIVSLLQTGKSFTHPDTQRAFNNYLFNYGFFKNMLVWSVITALTQFILHVNDKFGQYTLWNFIRGKYHSAKEENRIFMFVDLLSSTTIAESLGHEKYHNLLHDFYADITNPILYNKGEIYQYVGDEVIISWQLPTGRANNHCLKCYFDMRKTITDLKEKYISKYGFVPDFKAGLHYGKVIAGEVGIIKREITFSGDVMNTASRIQSKCNEYRVKILSSDELLQLLSYNNDYLRIPIGDVELKGKESKVALSTVQIRI
jgi:adenylate cyclase